MNKYIFYCLTLFFLFSCKEEKLQEYSDQMDKNEQELLSPNTPDFRPIMQKIPGEKEVNKLIKSHNIKDKEVKKIMSEIAYDADLVRVFTHLSEVSKGEMKYAEDANATLSNIIFLLEKHTQSNTDIILMIDRTSSMLDDLDATKNNIDKIIGTFSKLQNVKISIVTYGDKYEDGKLWYTRYPLSANFEKVKKIVKEIDLVDGGDFPESVNDAIYRTLTETQWTPGSNKMMLIVGDAPSHKKPYSNVDLEDIVRLCKSKNIVINFYPIIIAVDVNYKQNVEVQDEAKPDVLHFIQKIEMNYSKESCRIDLKYGSTYKVELYTIKGEKLAEAKFFGSKYDLDVSNYNNGAYVVRILDEQNNQIDGQFFDIYR
jgi:hypothetical protein